MDVDLQGLRLEGAEAALAPLGGDEGIDQGADFGSGGLVAVVVLGGKKFESRGSSPGMTWGCASMPDLRALKRTAASTR